MARDGLCGRQFGGWCTERSGNKQNLQHLCGEIVSRDVRHPSDMSPHVCSACTTRSTRD